MINRKHAIILRGPPAIGKSCVTRLLVAKIPRGQSKQIDLDQGWGPIEDLRYPATDRRYGDLKANVDFLILELCCGEPLDASFKGATRNPREWVSILESEGRRIHSFCLWTDAGTWKKRLLKKVPNGDPVAEQYFKRFETEEWKWFAERARVQEETIDTTTINEDEVANRIWERIQEKANADQGTIWIDINDYSWGQPNWLYANKENKKEEN